MPPPTPLEPAPLELRQGHDVYLKREDVHELGAFKWRGALATIHEYAARGASAVVTASTGNHGAATAWAASQSGLRAIVYVPAQASRTKVDLIERHGAELRATGRDIDEAKDEARAFAAANGLPFFEDGAEPAQLRGYGAIAGELLEQLPEQPAAVVVPVGNGALLGGIGLLLGDRSPATLRVGVVAREAPVMALSWEAKQPVESDRCATFADGLAVRVAIPFAVETLNRAADRMLLASERELALGAGALARAGIRAEAAAAAPLAALGRLGATGGPVVAIITGRNIDDELLDRALNDPSSFPE